MIKKILIALFIFPNFAVANEIYINKVKLNDNEISVLISTYGQVQPGKYWYDSMAGLWGYENGPTQGKALPYVNFRGKLPADISGRGTNIFINNR